MNVNNYECPKCHNVFPLANKMMHDLRCTENNPIPLNQSRLVGINSNNLKNENKKTEPIQHRPQPKITAKRKIDSHINPLNIKESIMEIPETFNCWLCGQTLPEKEKEDHMLCHQMQEENDNFKKKQKNQKNKNQNQNPQHYQKPHKGQNNKFHVNNKGLHNSKDHLKGHHNNKGHYKLIMLIIII